MEYKIELHCHTSPVSGCSRLSGKELVGLYTEAGYSAVHITDHFTADFFAGHSFGEYFKGYGEAADEGRKRGLKVFLGAEFRFKGSSNDYLLFGVSREFLRRALKMFTATNAEFYAFCKKNGVLIYQAHPFRDGMTRAPKETLDGIEIYNMHPYHKSRNELACEYAKENNLHGISGSDAHEAEMVGRGGILSRRLPNDEKDLADLILSGEYELLTIK